jgi:hypothetical protein
MNRRTLLASVSTVAASLVAGCGSRSADEQTHTDRGTPADSTASRSLAHTVSVYLGEREEAHDVTVTVRDGDDAVLFERTYVLSDEDEADEDATFPASTDPQTVTVTVDGTRFERDWPGFEVTELPCEGDSRAGVELYVENGPDGSPTLRLAANCQSVVAA